MPEAVRILVRTDVDWTSMDREQFGAQDDRDRPLLFITFARNRGLFELWDQTFAIDYFDFRRQLADIARRNHLEVEEATYTVGLSDFDRWLADPADEWVVPVDDDDYFSPELVSHLRSQPADVGVVCWPELHWVVPSIGDAPTDRPANSQPVIKRPDFPVLWTNNWAVRKSFLTSTFDAHMTRRILVDHSAASTWIGRALGRRTPEPPRPWYEFSITGPGVVTLPDTLSLTLKHPGSLFLIWTILQTENPSAKLRGADFGGTAVLPAGAGWAEPWVRQAEQLMASLRSDG